MLESISGKNLIWLPEKGVGYFPVEDFPYDDKYFEKYEGYAATELGKRLTRARVDFVKKHYDGAVVDVGIGSGQFLKAHGAAKGYDVNLRAVDWLKKENSWHDIYDDFCDAMTFWDSLEHIKDMSGAIIGCRKFVFVSIPIFYNCNHVLASKHYRKDEHFWYFTRKGLIDWFSETGFDLIGEDSFEQNLGREDIGTFAFRRRQ